MAKVELAPSLGALRGKIGRWVYRQQDGQTIVSPYRAPKKKTPSAAQKEARARFQAAHAYATQVLADPLRRRVYQKLGSLYKRPPNALLASNFLTPPEIEIIEASHYTGRAGSTLGIVVFDPIAVASVTVAVRGPNGALLESGEATSEHGVWRYLATVDAPVSGRLQVEVTARNRARAEARQIVEVRAG